MCHCTWPDTTQHSANYATVLDCVRVFTVAQNQPFAERVKFNLKHSAQQITLPLAVLPSCGRYTRLLQQRCWVSTRGLSRSCQATDNLSTQPHHM